MKGCLRVFLWIFIGIPATIAALIAVGVWWHSATVRYRLTLVVEADGQQHTGSGVLELDCEDTLWILSSSIGGGRSCSVKGQAIPVDLGARGVLFVTLHGRFVGVRAGRGMDTDPIYLQALIQAFPDAGKDAQGHQQFLPMLRALKRAQPKADLPLGLLPMLVRFRDIKDPKSVAEVSPYDLGASFGPGAKLVKATIAITDDWVKGGIEKLLPWLDGLRGLELDGSRYLNSTRLSNALGTGDFQIRN